MNEEEQVISKQWERFPVYLLAGFYILFALIIVFVPADYRQAITVDGAILNFGQWPLAIVVFAVGIYAFIENLKFSKYRGLYAINVLTIFWLFMSFVPLEQHIPNHPSGFNAFACITWLLILSFSAYRYITLKRIDAAETKRRKLEEFEQWKEENLLANKERTQL